MPACSQHASTLHPAPELHQRCDVPGSCLRPRAPRPISHYRVTTMKQTVALMLWHAVARHDNFRNLQGSMN